MGKFDIKDVDIGERLVEKHGDKYDKEVAKTNFVKMFLHEKLIAGELDGMTIDEMVEYANEHTDAFKVSRYKVKEALEHLDPIDEESFRWERRETDDPGHGPKELSSEIQVEC